MIIIIENCSFRIALFARRVVNEFLPFLYLPFTFTIISYIFYIYILNTCHIFLLSIIYKLITW